MSDRLAELQRQRALLQDHLAWLDREIAAESGRGRPPAQVARPAPFVAPAMQVPVSPSPADSEAILSQYRQEPGTLKQDVRKGCFLYFALAFLAFGALVLALYLRLPPRH
jgi:hypothetical protein